MTDNLGLWNSVQKTPVEHTKEITGKSYRGNSPKPHWLVMRATEVFGPCGIGWGFAVVDERIEEGAGGEKLHIARVKVWYKWNGERGEVEHIGGTQFSGKRSNGKDFTDEDAPKKSVTDALVKALSMIGFAGDIFLGRYDDSKYVSELREEERDRKSAANRQQPSNDKEPPFLPQAASDRIHAAIEKAMAVKELNELYLREEENIGKIRAADTVIADLLMTAFKMRKEIINSQNKDAA